MDIGLRDSVIGYDGYLLMKFMESKKYQQDFLDGKLFFNTSDYFARCESAGRHDDTEGNDYFVNIENPGMNSLRSEFIDGKMYIVIRDYKNNPEEFKPSNVLEYSAACNRNRKLISFYTLYVNLKEERYKPIAKRMLDEFGEYGIIILNRKEFFSRVANVLKADPQYKEIAMGFVKYKKIGPGVNSWSVFSKDIDRFEYQQEFRITFLSDNSEAMVLDLGTSLRDIVKPICTRELGKLHFENGKLAYPICEE